MWQNIQIQLFFFSKGVLSTRTRLQWTTRATFWLRVSFNMAATSSWLSAITFSSSKPFTNTKRSSGSKPRRWTSSIWGATAIRRRCRLKSGRPKSPSSMSACGRSPGLRSPSFASWERGAIRHTSRRWPPSGPSRSPNRRHFTIRLFTPCRIRKSASVWRNSIRGSVSSSIPKRLHPITRAIRNPPAPEWLNPPPKGQKTKQKIY